MRIGNRSQFESRAREQTLGDALDALPVLQGAGRVKRDAAALFRKQRFDAVELRGHHLRDVTRHGADFLGPLRVGRIVPEKVAVFPDGGAAAACGHDDRLHVAARDRRPPVVDQGAHVAEAAGLIADMKAQRAAAAGPFGFDERDADAVEHARRGGVDVGG